MLTFIAVMFAWQFMVCMFSPVAKSTRELKKINQLYEAHTNRTKTETEVISTILETNWRYRGKEARELAGIMNAFLKLKK